jgi:hypothetical protein
LDFSGLFPIILGILLIIFRKPFSEKSVREQNQYLKRNYSQKDIERNQIAAIIVGICAIILGIVAFLRIHP